MQINIFYDKNVTRLIDISPVDTVRRFYTIADQRFLGYFDEKLHGQKLLDHKNTNVDT